MYSLKPIVTDLEVDKPRNIYEMNSIRQTDNPTDKFLTKLQQSLKVDKEGDLNELEEKQELLLEKLKQLKLQLVSLQDGLPICRKPVQESRNSFPDGVVIFVDPSTVPYSLLLVLKRTPLAFSVTFHTHSTVSELPEEAKRFADEVQGLSSGSGARVTVIWRQGMPTSFQVIIGGQGSPFWGEDNFIRYLTRLGILEKSDDLLLDMSHHLLALAEDKKEQTKAADRLLGALKRQKPSQSVDFAAYSALRNFRNATKGGRAEAALKELEARL